MSACAVLVAAVTAGAAVPWREAPEYMDLFAPAAERDAYRASVSPAAIEAVLDELRDDPASLQAPGAWAARAVGPLDAFGQSGAYDRSKLVRLYRGRQPRVARGARVAAGRVTESWTLISPYPSADFTRLEPGTLRVIIRLTIDD